MSEPQYDATDMDTFYLMEEKRAVQRQRDALLSSLREMAAMYDGEDGNTLINQKVWAKVLRARQVLAEVDRAR